MTNDGLPPEVTAELGEQLFHALAKHIDDDTIDPADALAALCSACALVLLNGSNDLDELLEIWRDLSSQVADIVRHEFTN